MHARSCPPFSIMPQCCRQCGCVETKYRHGVAFCNNTAVHAFQTKNRDVEAARKIACRLYAELKLMPLGPWARGNAPVILPSSALLDAQVRYDMDCL
jgi:hypothetical protein